MANYIRTYTGQKVDVFSPTPDMFVLEDIAHALSQVCRFGGHTPSFYSVAEHSIRVADYVFQVSPDWALEALMHDATEAYIQDMPRPIKLLLPEYKKLEDNLHPVIFEAFGLRWPMDPIVKLADEAALGEEMMNIVGTVRRHTLAPSDAEAKFLEMFKLYDNLRTKKGASPAGSFGNLGGSSLPPFLYGG